MRRFPVQVIALVEIFFIQSLHLAQFILSFAIEQAAHLPSRLDA